MQFGELSLGGCLLGINRMIKVLIYFIFYCYERSTYR